MSDIKSCLIIAGGEFNKVDTADYDYVIACDRGYDYALRMGITPDIVIGDLDSITSEIKADANVIRLPAEKDDTDTMYAIKYATDKGCKILHVCCAFGGRFDHSIANLQAAAFAADRKVKTELSGVGTKLYVLRDESIELNKTDESYISVFALSDICEGVSLKGLKYELESAQLSNRYPLGVSNEWKDDICRIEVKKGILAVIICNK